MEHKTGKEEKKNSTYALHNGSVKL